MGDKTWKQVERKLARLFGAERNQDTHGCDFHTRMLVNETKHRTKPIITIDEWFAEAEMYEAEMREEHGARVPMLAYHVKGRRVDESYCIVRARDLAVWHRVALIDRVKRELARRSV